MWRRREKFFLKSLLILQQFRINLNRDLRAMRLSLKFNSAVIDSAVWLIAADVSTSKFVGDTAVLPQSQFRCAPFTRTRPQSGALLRARGSNISAHYGDKKAAWYTA